MSIQVRFDGCISIEDFVDLLFVRRILLPKRSCGNESIDVEFVGIKKEPCERFRIVGLVTNISQNDNVWLALESWNILSRRWHDVYNLGDTRM